MGHRQRETVVTIRVDGHLAGILENLPNRSAFIRDAIIHALARQCPSCGGAGVVPAAEPTTECNIAKAIFPAAKSSQSWRTTTSKSQSRTKRTGPARRSSSR
jgi:hypothetical protein